MKKTRMSSILAAVIAFAATSTATALEIKLPQETAMYKPSNLPGYALALQNCMTCHSAQYVATQPTTSSRTYWEATVKKMKTPFGAPLKDADIPVIVDYLVKTYGAEKGDAVSPAARK